MCDLNKQEVRKFSQYAIKGWVIIQGFGNSFKLSKSIKLINEAVLISWGMRKNPHKTNNRLS